MLVSLLFANFIALRYHGDVARADSVTTTTSPSKQITGGSLALLQLSEQQFQLRFIYSLSGGVECTGQGAFSETWYAPSAGQWSIGDGNTYTGGSAATSSNHTIGICGTSWDSGRVFNIWGLQTSTTYTVTVTGGYAGNMVTASRSVTTSGNGWQNSTTSTITSGSSTTNGSSTTTTTIDAPLYMARIDSNSIVIDVCVCSESFVRANPSRYPGTWVPMWMGVNGKNYAGPGWTYDPVAENFYPPTTTTTSTTPPSSVTIEPTTTSSSESKSGDTDTTVAGSSNSSSANSVQTTTTTAVPNGEVRASVGGVEVKSETIVEEGAVTVSVGEVTAKIANAEASDDSTNTQAEQGLVLSSGESANVSVDGLQPNTEVEVVIYSTPRNLGSLQVNEFGELVASIQIPSDMESGPHTLVLSGLDKFGKQIELKFGLVVYSPAAYIPVWVWFLVGLLVISLAVSLVSRRSKKVVIAT